MSWTVSVVTSATTDTQPSLVVNIDQANAKYIFNVAENSNRAYTQKGSHGKKTRAFFLTQVGAQRAGGLAGMLMCSADQSMHTLDVVGPPGLLHTIASMRSYIYRRVVQSMAVNIKEVALSSDLSSSPNPTYQDKNLTVYSIPILDDSHAASLDSTVCHEETTHFSTPRGSVKRKREPSPVDESLSDLMAEPGFSAEKLQGELADEWRRLMVKHMFPSTGLPPPPEKKCRDRDAPRQKRPKRCPEETPEEEPEADGIQDSRPRIPAGYHHQLPKFTPSWSVGTGAAPTSAYVVVGPSIRGKFDVEKSLALGVAVNQRSALTKGESVTVTVEEGDMTVEKVVHPHDCIGPSETPPAMIVLDIPSPAFINSIVYSFAQSPFYAKLRSSRPEDISETVVRTVFHLVGEGVLHDPRYIEFMNGFPANAHHVISSPECGPDPVTFTTAAFNQLRLHQLDPVMFPIPYYSLKPQRELSVIPGLPANCVVMESTFHMSSRPGAFPEYNRLPWERRDCFHPALRHPHLLMLSSPLLKKFTDVRAKIEERIANGTAPTTSKGSDVVVIPLGTASAVPTSSRNVSSTLIRIPGRGSLLLDAGEGTWGQLARHFGPEVDDVLRDLRCIFVSHIHGDHHAGVAKILLKRRQLNPRAMQPLYLVGVHKLHLYLRELADIEDLGLTDPNGVVTVISDALHVKRSGEYLNRGMWRIEGSEPWTDYERSVAAGMRLCVALGLERFATIDVFHQVKCYGVCIRSQDGWSIVFSGDTLPTQSLVRGGWAATLLIHEATMGDGEEEMARCKAHSTVGQAIDTARRMNAENVLLTHFSARYPRMPPPIESSGIRPPPGYGAPVRDPVVALAFDNVNLTIGNMWKLSMYLSVIQKAFADTKVEADEEEAKVARAAIH
ncbi:hypothetical protein FB45DRAFT_752560 [Roridomyces roridus]|uniref:ribonuclease Z n=1 Tax=Roridomyces roridus TaxID=1738132 RepID=A0AAD7FJG8_9AGAR|nr:hypothetical protein FB45DRAFT_752560 [Roridomyces roridus]